MPEKQNDIENTDKLLLLGSRKDLIDACNDSPDFIRRRLDHLVWIARNIDKYPEWHVQKLNLAAEGLVRPLHRPDEFSYQFLAYLLTGELEMAESGRRQLLALAESVAERELGDWTQLHTWCDAFPFGRWLIYYDWIHDSGVFSDADHKYLRESFLYYLWAHPGQRLKARAIEGTPCNNQNAAMAFANVVGGALFAIKRSSEPQARQLLTEGMPHLVRFVSAFPRGGYSFEGSTYMGGVNAYILPLALELIHDITGIDMLDCRENENCASPRETLQSIMRLMMPGGLMLPWDNYGYQRAAFGPAAAYYAKRSGDASVLNYLIRAGDVDRPAHSGWGFDAKLWTLAMAPRRNASTGLVNFNHTEPSLGASSTGPAGELFFFQMWDKSDWPPSRAQFNPNSIIMNYNGAPLIIDGRTVEVAKESVYREARFCYIRYDTGESASYGGGSVGAHNTIFFDDEDHVAPHRCSEGQLLKSAYSKGAAAFEADVTDCFADNYDVELVRRASLVVGDDYVLVRDRVVSKTPHRINWRIHLRAGNLSHADGYAHLTTMDFKRLEICAADDVKFAHRHFGMNDEDSPSSGELGRACHELTRLADGRDVHLAHLLVPGDALKLWHALNGPWQWIWAADSEDAERHLQAWPAANGEIDLEKGDRFYQTCESRPGIALYRKQIIIDSLPRTAVWLRLPGIFRSSRIVVNSSIFTVTIEKERLPLLPILIDVSDALKTGINTLIMEIPSTMEAAANGPAALLIQDCEPIPAKLSDLGNGIFEVEHNGMLDRIDWREDRISIQRPNGEKLILDMKPPLPDRTEKSHACPACDAVLKTQNLVSERVEHARRSVQELRSAAISDDWRIALPAFEEAAESPSPEMAELAYKLLRRSMTSRSSEFPRNPEDICWYRLKAGYIRILGVAKYRLATETLGKILTGKDFYPVRVAAAVALKSIGTAEATEWLRRISPHDEHNVALTSGSRLE